MHLLQTRLAFVATALFATVASAQQIDVAGTVTAVNANPGLGVLAQVGPATFYPYTGLSTGSGTASGITDFTSLDGVLPSRITYEFALMDLTTFVSGGVGGTSVEIYTPGVGSTFRFMLDGATLATGEVQSLQIDTNYDTGAATGFGYVTLSAPGLNPAFFNEINMLTGGTNRVDFAISNFSALGGDLSSFVFASSGNFTVTAVPEPASAAAIFGVAALVLVLKRRRRSAG